MREGVSFVREGGPAAPRAAKSLLPFLRRHRPTWAIAAAGAVLLAGVDAFGSGGTAAPTLYSYWFGMMLVTALVTSLLLERLEKRPWLAARPFTLRAALVLVLAAAMTPIVWIAAALVLGGSTQPGKMATIFPQAVLIGVFFVALQWALERLAPPGASASPSAPHRQPALLGRLPQNLQGGELEAIEAEDHYLRIHTDRGSTLILMRLTDAMDELEGMEGARTHRSWWVARAAVLAVSRGRGRAKLTLKSGLCAPVSRTYARGLRGAGWF